MKAILTLFILLSGINFGFSQACGVYMVNYKAMFQNDSLEVKEVRLPTTVYLHGTEEADSRSASLLFKVVDMEVDDTMISHLTSANPDANYLIGLYKENHSAIPVTIIARDNNNNEFKIGTEIGFDDLEFKIPEPESRITLTINLGTITF